ncbi:unnamed protein product [Effrenium voratum]|nr:unnamed protein product [Effrenium voratum]
MIEDLDELGLSNLAWAHAKLELESLALFAATAGTARLPKLTVQNLANTSWAFAKVGLVDQAFLHATQEQAMGKMSECTAFDLSILTWSFDALCAELSADFMHRALAHFTKELELEGDVGMFWFDVANVALTRACPNREAFEKKFRERLLQHVEDSLRNLSSRDVPHLQSFESWQSLVDMWNIPYLGPAYTKLLFQQQGVMTRHRNARVAEDAPQSEARLEREKR